MNVKVSRSALENTIKLLMEADPTGLAQEPEGELDNAAKIARKVKELEDSKTPTLSVGDRTFIKQGKKFFIKDIQISTEDLLNLVKDDVRERLQKEIDKGEQSIGIRGDEFIEPVARGASFSSEGRGTWVDLAEVPVDIVAEYILRAEGDIADTAAYVSGEVTESAGKHLVYRTTELSIVIPEGSKDVYIMSTQNDPNDPLGSALQLLKSANILAEWRANPIRFYELVGKGPEPGRNFAFQIDEKMKLGGFNKALKSIRTTAGKFFDFLNPFEGANIEVNFKFTEFGPALVRANVFGGTGFRIQAGGLTDTDLARLSGTDYFRFESLDRPVDAEYNFRAGMEAPIEPSDIRNKAGNPYFKEAGKIKVDNVGVAVNPEEDGSPKQNTLTFDYGFGRALWIYLKGYLEEKKAPVEEPPEPVVTVSAPEPADPLASVKPLLDKPIIDGAVYFKFNKSGAGDYEEEPAAYINSVNSRFAELYNTIPQNYWESDAGNDKALAVMYVGSADPKGGSDANIALAKARAETIRAKSEAVIGPKSKLVNSQLWYWSLGESLWKENEVVLSNLTDDQRKPLRMVRAFLVMIRAVDNDNSGGTLPQSNLSAIKADCKNFGLEKVKEAVPDIVLRESKTGTHKTAERNLLERLRGEGKMNITLRQFRQMIREEIAKEDAPAGESKPERLLEKDPKPAAVEVGAHAEESQHNNDAESADPMLKSLKEAALRDLRLADRILRRR